MKKIVPLFLALALSAGCCFFQPADEPRQPAVQPYGLVVPAGAVTPEQAAELLRHYPEGALAILDVRTPEEFAAGHAEKAVNIPVQELQKHIAEVPPSPLLILCRSGKRAEKAFGLLRDGGRGTAETWYMKGFTDYRDGVPAFHE